MLEEDLARAARIQKGKELLHLEVLLAEPEMPLRQEGLEVRAPRSGPHPGLGVEEQEEALCGPDLAVLQEVLEPQQQWPEGQSWLPVWRHRLEVPEALKAHPR